MDSFCQDTILNQRMHRLLLSITGLLCRSTKLSFAKGVCATQSLKNLESQFDLWSTFVTRRTFVLSFVVTDFW